MAYHKRKLPFEIPQIEDWSLEAIQDRAKQIYLKSRTSLEELLKAGIIPLWLYNDAEPHGMSEAENLLCEFDWEWGWDLGDSMTKPQLAILASIRSVIATALDW